MKIAFVGPAAVGKDAVSDFIAKKFGLMHVSSGDIIRKYVVDNNLGELVRENLNKVGNELRKKEGGDVLVRIAMKNASENIVLSGLRAIDEVKTFKKLGGKVIAITAPIELRFELAKKRQRISDKVSFEDFKKIEDIEYSSNDRNGQNVSEVILMADLEIVNNGTLEELFNKCSEAVEKLSQ